MGWQGGQAVRNVLSAARFRDAKRPVDRAFRVGARDQSKALSTVQTFQTLPTRSGPGLRVCLPGRHPDGVA